MARFKNLAARHDSLFLPVGQRLAADALLKEFPPPPGQAPPLKPDMLEPKHNVDDLSDIHTGVLRIKK
ncbi:MAG TPA: hypothetical protein VH933_17280 [Aestuariivirgaceae bacterium]|jgi:hypothetical protein